MMFTDPRDIKQPDKFDCRRCEKIYSDRAQGKPYINFTAKARKCNDPCWDNGNVAPFPVQIGKFKTPYKYCPGKVLRDDRDEILDLFNQLIVTYRTGVKPDSGNYYDQSPEFTELLPWFIVKYDNLLMGQALGGFGDIMVNIVNGIFGKKRK